MHMGGGLTTQNVTRTVWAREPSKMDMQKVWIAPFPVWGAQEEEKMEQNEQRRLTPKILVQNRGILRV